MVYKDIVEGLRLALSRGYTLEQAMMSFYNAGYKKEDIEDAARVLSYHPETPLSHPEKPIPEHLKKPVAKALPTQKPKEEPKPKGKVSKYEEKQKVNLKIILLIIFLFVLIGAFMGIYIFKDKLIAFFSRFA